MLRRKAITRWTDVFAELENVLSMLGAGEGANLNLMRRSIVAWKRNQGEQQLPSPGPEFVSLTRHQLDELEETFCSAHQSILEFSTQSFKDARELIQKARTIIHSAFLSSRSDQQILAMSANVYPSEALMAELERRGLTKATAIRHAKPSH